MNTTSSRIERVYLDVDLRNGHQGLAQIAMMDGKNPRRLKPGRFLIFMNHANTAFKLMTANNYVAHFKREKGKVSYDDLAGIAATFYAEAGNTMLTRTAASTLRRDWSVVEVQEKDRHAA